LPPFWHEQKLLKDLRRSLRNYLHNTLSLPFNIVDYIKHLPKGRVSVLCTFTNIGVEVT
jgi:hypothetical protein